MMKRTKKIALIMLAVVLMAVCFVFGVSAETWGDYEYAVLEDGTVKITNYNGSATELVIPEVIDGKTVTVIGERSFSANKTIETLVVGNNIITIEESAFRVNSLKEITISDSVKSIGYWAFYGTAYYNDDVNWENGALYIGNHLIKAIVSGNFKIKEGTVTIANYAFDDCDDLHSLTIPATVRNIVVLGIENFNFEKFYVDEANLDYSSDDNGILYNKSKTVLIRYPMGNKQNYFDIPNTVKTIMPSAFMGAIYLMDVHIPESVNYIGSDAFSVCINLKNININSNISELNPRVFFACFSLENLYIPSTVKNIGSQAVWDNLGNNFYIAGMDVNFSEGNIFTGITDIQNLTKEEFINKLNLSVTTDDENLRDSLWAEIEASLTFFAEETYTGTIYCHSGSTAEAYAIAHEMDYELIHFFEGEWTYDYDNMIRTRKCIHCDELETEELEIPEAGDTGTWGDYEYIVLEDGTVEITKYNGSDTELVIPEMIEGKSVTVIGEDSFFGCFKAVKIKIPKTVIRIEGAAFEGSLNLKFIEVDKDNENFTNDEFGVLFNKEKTELIKYPTDSYLTAYDIPNTIKVIRQYAVEFSHNLCSVNMSQGVVKIEDRAFWGCMKLENINFPDTLSTIGYESFNTCISLKNICISENVESIDSYAFSDTINEKVYIRGMKTALSEKSVFGSTLEISGISNNEFSDLYRSLQISGDPKIQEELLKHIIYYDGYTNTGTIYCHSGSTAETYAIENGVDYELTHFFEDEWTYDYDNMIRTRKCIHCDELQVEEIEIEEIKGDNFLVVEETVTNGIEGDVEVLKAFDINLKNSEGVHVQPDGSIKVKLPNDWSKSGIYKVYRVNDDGTLTDMNAYREGSHLVFDTDHFSIYVIVFTPDETTEEEPETPDTPAEPDTSGCMCLCHKTDVFSELLMSIFRFLTKLLGVFPVCQCGVAHY